MTLLELLYEDYKTMALDGKTPSKLRILRLYLSRNNFKIIVWYRLGYWLRNNKFKLFAIWLDRRIWKRGVDICSAAKIGKGVRIAHPHGIVIGGEVEIGDYVYIQQGVTLGGSSGSIREDDKNWTMPHIEDYVFIGPGAKILGPIHIGKYSIIGANSVVTKDVPDYSFVGGVPGKIIKHLTPEEAKKAGAAIYKYII